ncbi:MAG TPA: transglycosylase domain-containing protein [Solirubrobacterales bacterium]|jgi:penicillin-binding protein 1A|nr:transglycosylase domain-containing protein [Solirubrobacterales bacterium]
MAQRNRRRQRRRGGAPSKLLFIGAGLLVTIALAGIAIASWVLDVAAEAPSLAACKTVDRGGNSVIYAGDGSKLGLIDSEEARAPVAIDRIPKQLQLATVAIEDQRFYEHGGIDPEGIARAALKNLEAGKTVEGGSTITQQLVRNLCIRNPKRDLERKIIEAKLAIEYSERHTRKEILDQYLNTASYGTVEGATATGVQAASKIYFSKPVWKLRLEQAALLAGLPQAPSDYNPILNPRGALQRRNEVLAKMAHLGYISRARAAAAEQHGLGLDASGSYFAHREPFFFDYVENELIERYGVDAVRKGGLKVYTTIQPRLQEVGLEAMRSALPFSTDPSSALVSIDPGNGEIEAMVSSSSYGQSQFNLAAQGHRQPGSTFKAFVLTTAIKQGIDPYTTYYTSKPLDLNLPKWGHWEVHTADEGYLGRVNLQQATVASDNTVFAQLDLDVGPQRVAETAHSMGITSPLDGIPAEGIGGLRVGVSPLEMADAYATLADGGVHHDPIAIRRVAFPGGRIERPHRTAPRRVISEAVAYEVTRLLHDNITEGTGTAAYTGCAGQAGKTGTTDRETDAWFAGYQPNLTSVVWVGYPQSNAIEMTSVHGITVFGGTFPAEIWHSLYSGAEVPCEEFSKPKTPIQWAPFFGNFTDAAPRPHGSIYGAANAEAERAKKLGEEATGGYNPDAYAPGAGQEPTPLPPPAPSTGVGGGAAAGEAGSE